MQGPASSYSCLEIHICWKEESEARIEPPIHTEYLRSGGAIIFTYQKEILIITLKRWGGHKESKKQEQAGGEIKERDSDGS